MDKKTGEELVKKELLSKVDEKDDTKPLDKLPAVTAEQGVLFAKEKVENATLDGAKLKYEAQHNYRKWPCIYRYVCNC